MMNQFPITINNDLNSCIIGTLRINKATQDMLADGYLFELAGIVHIDGNKRELVGLSFNIKPVMPKNDGEKKYEY